MNTARFLKYVWPFYIIHERVNGQNILKAISKLTFTCSKSKETLEKRCEICSKLIIKSPEQRHWRRSGGFIVNFEHILQIFRVFLLLKLNKEVLAGMELKVSYTYILNLFSYTYWYNRKKQYLDANIFSIKANSPLNGTCVYENIVYNKWFTRNQPQRRQKIYVYILETYI